MEKALEIISQYLPTVLAVISLVITTIKNIRGVSSTTDTLATIIEERIKETSEQLKESNQLGDIKLQLQQVIQDNKKLKKQIAELLEALTRVKSNDNEEV